MNGYEQSSVPHQDFINSYKNNYYTNNYVQNIKNWYDYAAGQRCYNESGYQEFNKEQLGNYYGGNKKQEQTFDATQSNFVKSPLPASVYPEHEPCSKVQPGTSYVSGYTPNATYDRPLKEFELENRTSCINNFELSPPQRYHTPLSCDPNLLNGKNIAIEASLCLQNIVSAQISGQNIAEVQNLATLQEGANAQIVRSDKDISSIVLPRVNHITKTQNIKNVSDVQKDTINEVPSKNSEAKFPKLRELLSKPKNEKVVSPYCNITPINYKSQHKNIAQRELMELLEFDDLAPWIEKGTVKRTRKTYSKEQTLQLELYYHYNKYLTRKMRKELSTKLQLTEIQIKTWFQNRRMKDKKKPSTSSAENDDVQSECSNDLPPDLNENMIETPRSFVNEMNHHWNIMNYATSNEVFSTNYKQQFPNLEQQQNGPVNSTYPNYNEEC